MHQIAAISLDLDDTLWPVQPVIKRAERKLYAWFKANCPRVTEKYRPEDILALRDRVILRHSEYKHDFAFLRRRVIEQLLTDVGYSTELTEVAYSHFLSARNKVQLFADVVPALDRLRQDFVLLALTNGNADLDVIGLSEFFDHQIRAADVGAAKPHARIFDAAICAAGVSARQIVHVGDSPQHDVLGATKAGMEAVWINRFRRHWPGPGPAPRQLYCLAGLVKLLIR